MLCGIVIYLLRILLLKLKAVKNCLELVRKLAVSVLACTICDNNKVAVVRSDYLIEQYLL